MQSCNEGKQGTSMNWGPNPQEKWKIMDSKVFPSEIVIQKD